mmetsp:Transcript_61600/g.134913  ORF Transcript_61600/g.134913 Transcript_61600/m.134913 type:complete len:248 (+) Transcript_61600:75-818(+)
MGGAMCQCDKAQAEKVIVHAIPASCCTNIQSANEDSKCVLNQRLLAASRDNDIGALKIALEEGAYLETRRPFVMRPKPPTSVWDQDPTWNSKKRGPKEGMTPLMYASQNGSPAAVRMLLQARANFMAKDEDGMRPLHFAAQAASQEVCKLLVQKGADTSATDDEGRGAIDFLPSDELLGGNALDWQELFGMSFEPVIANSKVCGLGSLAALASSELNPQGPSYLPPAPFMDNETDVMWLGDEPIKKT